LKQKKDLKKFFLFKGRRLLFIELKEFVISNLMLCCAEGAAVAASVVAAAAAALASALAASVLLRGWGRGSGSH